MIEKIFSVKQPRDSKNNNNITPMAADKYLKVKRTNLQIIYKWFFAAINYFWTKGKGLER